MSEYGGRRAFEGLKVMIVTYYGIWHFLHFFIYIELNIPNGGGSWNISKTCMTCAVDNKNVVVSNIIYHVAMETVSGYTPHQNDI